MCEYNYGEVAERFAFDSVDEYLNWTCDFQPAYCWSEVFDAILYTDGDDGVAIFELGADCFDDSKEPFNIQVLTNYCDFDRDIINKIMVALFEED